jgi:hypothetical protein
MKGRAKIMPKRISDEEADKIKKAAKDLNDLIEEDFFEDLVGVSYRIVSCELCLFINLGGGDAFGEREKKIRKKIGGENFAGFKVVIRNGVSAFFA